MVLRNSTEDILKDAEHAVRHMERKFQRILEKVVSSATICVSQPKISHIDENREIKPLSGRTSIRSASYQTARSTRRRPQRPKNSQSQGANLQSLKQKHDRRYRSVDDRLSQTQRTLSKIQMKTPKWEMKLKVLQPFKLRQPTETKKIFGFGSFLRMETVEKPLVTPKQLYHTPGWRTFLRSHTRKLAEKAEQPEVKPSRKRLSTRSGSLSRSTVRSSHRCQPQAEFSPIEEMEVVSYLQGKPLPFVTCRSSRSFNLRLNVQEVLSLVKRKVPKAITYDPLSHRSAAFSICPAMAQPPVDILDVKEVWGGSCVSARCVCFPVYQYRRPKLPVRGSSEWGWSDGNLNMLQECVNGVKKDWTILQRKVRSVMNGTRSAKEEAILEIEGFESALKERLAYYQEMETVIAEAKKVKEQLASWKRSRKPPPEDLKRVLRRIHSTL